MVERLYASLMIQMVTASRAFIKAGTYKEETSLQRVRIKTEDYYGRTVYDYDYQHRPVSGLTARLEFQSAFSRRIESRLATAKREAELAAMAEDNEAGSENTGTALVLADKQDTLAKFYKSHTAKLRGSYKSHQSSTTSRVSRDAGRSAADNARLSASQELPGARRGLAS